MIDNKMQLNIGDLPNTISANPHRKHINTDIFLEHILNRNSPTQWANCNENALQ